MFALLKNTLGITKRSAKGKPVSARRSVRLGIEGLENREALSGFGDLSAALPPAAFQAPNAQMQALVQTVNQVNQSIVGEIHTFQTSIAREIQYFSTLFYDLTHQVPNFADVTFSMTSGSRPGENYTLLIQHQTDQFGGTASFTGLWGGSAPVTGTMSVVPDGSDSIQFSWTGGNGIAHTFTGSITGQLGAYQIVGDVTVQGGGGPGHLVGHQV